MDTFDLVDLMWTREDTSICVFDTPLEAKVLIYSSLTGELVARHQWNIVGMGVKNVLTSPDGVFMTIAFFD